MMFLEFVKEKLKKHIGEEDLEFSFTPENQLGDLSILSFRAAKRLKQAAPKLALEWANRIKNSVELKKFIIDVLVVGPYLNLVFTAELLAEKVIKDIQEGKEEYGFNKEGVDKKIMIEYSNVNTHKDYHVGHLRNLFYGESMARLFFANGYSVVRASYINDFGIHTARTVWNWKNNLNYLNQEKSKGYLLGKCYAEASQKLNDRPEYKKEVIQIMKEIESRQGENYSLWAETRQWSIDYFADIYNDLEIEFDHIFYESELVNDGLKLSEELLKRKILTISDGAVIANLEAYDLGVLVFRRNDGTALYPVADLALAVEKFSRYDLEESIYVVDIRQSQHFKQLFKVLDLLGYKQKLTHLPYEFVTLPEGMISSRSGLTVSYYDLKQRMIVRLEQETKSRHPDWSDEKISKIATALAMAAIKFEMLKINVDKVMIFNIEEALKFEGYTACYLEYSYARLQSILRKEGFKIFSPKMNFSVLVEEIEKNILIKLSAFPNILKCSLNNNNPSEVARYLYELAQLSNDYYHQINILKSSSNLKKARLSLIKAVSQVMSNAFQILGMPILEEM